MAMDSTVGAGAGSSWKKDKRTDLFDVIFSWSLQEIFNINLYKDKVLFSVSFLSFVFPPFLGYVCCPDLAFV